MNMSMWIKNPQESSPYFQIQALNPHTVDIMRYFCGDIDAVHCFATIAPGRTLWSTATLQHALQERRGGQADRQLRYRTRAPDGALRGGRTDGRFVIEDMFQQVTLFPAGNLQKTVYTNPIFGGMYGFEDTFEDRIHKLVERSARAYRRTRSMARGRTGWRRRRCSLRRSSRSRRGRLWRCDLPPAPFPEGKELTNFGE